AKLDPQYRLALSKIADVLRASGHRVDEVDFPYRDNTIALLSRWGGGVAESIQGLKTSKLERRTRWHARIGGTMVKWGLMKEAQAEQQRVLAEDFFREYDLMLTPTLTRIAPEAVNWH